MATLVKPLRNHRTVIFDRGSFDNWCVYVVEKNGRKHAPLDETYFNDLKNLSVKYPKDKIYNDFVAIYEQTSAAIDPQTLALIDEIVETYHPEDKILAEQWFTVIYAGMIAEENKENAILKKRVKRLGMHQVLVLNMRAKEAAQFSKGKKWRDLDAVMRPLGF